MDNSAPRPKVLVVDDETYLADTLSTILRLAGFEARPVYSGEAAIQTAPSFDPDLLLSDIKMGGIDGVQAAMKILETQPGCKVVFISGHAGTMDALAAARARGFNFPLLLKPVPPPELLGTISEILSRQSE